MKPSRFCAVIVFLLLALPLAVWGGQNFFKDGDAAPDFSGTALDGKPFRLSALKGHVVVLKLATTWCPTCQKQDVDFDNMREYLRDHNIQVVEVFLQEKESTIRNYLAKHNSEIPRTALISDGEVFSDYNVFFIPRVVVIDRQGIVRRDGLDISAYDLTKLLDPLVAGAPEAATGERGE